ncbi:MAG: HEPN domain-containing protein [Psychromonas sp.]
MSLSKKEVREITGFTFSKIGTDSENWMKRAIDFKEAAILIAKSDDYSPPFPYYYNSGIALELALKSIAIKQSKDYKKNHRLNDLCTLVGLKITKNQECTLELLSELIIWSGRYPVPKKEGQWNNYHDIVQEKHVVRESEGNVHRTLADRDRFPTQENFLTLWALCETEYKLSIAKKA